MLYIMGRRFAADGHDVTIFSAQPSYNDAYNGPPLPRKQVVDGMTIIRTPLFKESKKNAILRATNFVLFSISLFIHAVFRFRAYDLMTVTTFPPSIMGFVARWIGLFRKTKYIYHCMDLYPELALTSGILKRNSIANLAGWNDRRNCRKAEAVIVLSEDMKETVGKRGVSTDNVRVINNFIIDQVDAEAEIPEALVNRNNKFRVLFAGNIGRFQSLDTIVDAAKQLDDLDEIEFWFVGSGIMVDRLKEQAGDLLDRKVFFHPYLPITTVMSVIAQSNLGIVSLTPGVIECAYPSKTMSYLEAGCKLLALVEEDSSLAKLVNDERIGVVCGQPDAKLVADAIRSEYEQWLAHGHDRERICDVGRRHFSQEVILQVWADLIQELSN